jgi:hypothetical protein
MREEEDEDGLKFQGTRPVVKAGQSHDTITVVGLKRVITIMHVVVILCQR